MRSRVFIARGDVRIDGRGFPGDLTATQQFLTGGQVSFLVPVTVAAKATRLRTVLRKNVHGPAADEFDSGNADVFGLVAAAGLCSCPGSERDVPLFVTNQSAIRDRTAGHVASQILQYLVGRGVRRRGRLDVNDPPGGFLRDEPVFEGRRISQRRPFTIELQFSPCLQSTQSIEECGAEGKSQSVGIHQPEPFLSFMSRRGFVSWRASVLPLSRVLQRRSAAGNQRVHMNMSVQLLIPRVQYHRGCRFKLLLVFNRLFQSLPRAAEQQVEHLLPVAQRQ